MLNFYNEFLDRYDISEEVKLYLSRKHAIATKGDVTFFSRLIDSEYIAYDRIIPKNNDIAMM